MNMEHRWLDTGYNKTAVLGDRPVATLLFPLQVAHDRSGIDPEPPPLEESV